MSQTTFNHVLLEFRGAESTLRLFKVKIAHFETNGIFRVLTNQRCALVEIIELCAAFGFTPLAHFAKFITSLESILE